MLSQFLSENGFLFLWNDTVGDTLWSKYLVDTVELHKGFSWEQPIELNGKWRENLMLVNKDFKMEMYWIFLLCVVKS